MEKRARANALRSGVVVIGALAFGYLTLQLGFKPYLERVQQSSDHPQFPTPHDPNVAAITDSPSDFQESDYK